MDNVKKRKVGDHSGTTQGTFGKWLNKTGHDNVEKMTLTQIKEAFDKQHNCDFAISTMTQFLRAMDIKPRNARITRNKSRSKGGDSVTNRILARCLAEILKDLESEFGIEEGSIGSSSGAREALNLVRSGRPLANIQDCFRNSKTSE